MPFSEARWISASEEVGAQPAEDSHYVFRRCLCLDEKPSQALVRITADARYVLWVNGEFVGRGPARGFPWALPYDEFDLVPFLHLGANWLAAQVYQFGPGAGAFRLCDKGNGIYVSTGKTGLLMEGEVRFANASALPIRTDATWQVRRADWHLPVMASYLYGCFGFQEFKDARREPVGWRTGGESGGWQPAVEAAAPGEAPWTGFEARGMKPMRETLASSLPVVAAFSGTNAPAASDMKDLKPLWQEEKFEAVLPLPTIDPDGWVQVTPPAQGFVALVFDLGWCPAVYPRIEVRQAQGGEILDSGYGGHLGEENRPNVWGGACDRFIAAGGESAWQSFIPRGYRYHTVKVRADHPVTLRVRAVVTHHDVAEPLPFACSDKGLTKAWQVTERTLRTSMLDAFVDNSWREQTQWSHDGYVGATGAWATYGDTSLWRRLLWQTAQSAAYFSDGAVHSMVACDPVFQRAVMPIFDHSLHWLLSIEQYLAVTGDAGLLRDVLPAVRGLLMRHVESGFTTENLVIQPPGSKIFLDWTPRPFDKRPYNLTLNLSVLRALESAGAVAVATADADLADYCRRRGDDLRQAVTARFWSEEHQGWRENVEPSEQVRREVIETRPEGWLEDPWQLIVLKMAVNKEPTPCTRHGNALAAWLRVGSPEQQATAAELVVAAFEPDHACNNGMSFLWNDKIFGSLFESGKADEAIRLLQENQGTWALAGKLHWGETWGAGNVAQLCGSSLNWLLSGYVLGIRPAAAGFSEAIFDPRPGALFWAKGVVPTPHGDIRVQWSRGADGVIKAEITAPHGVTVRAADPGAHVTISTPSAGDELAAEILSRVEARAVEVIANATSRAAPSAQEFQELVTSGEWTEVWPDAEGKPVSWQVFGEIWNAAIQAALDQSGRVHLPKRGKPYYLDRPIMLKSGQTLIADPEAEIRLKPGSNTCMLRNKRVAGFLDRPVPADLPPDSDIFVQGGIWTTLSTLPRESNGNHRGQADAADSVPGCHGVILLQNVERVVVRDLTVRASRAFGVHIGTARDFLIENLKFEEHRRDGVHCDGPASYGVIRGISGWTGDDPVSLLSWDWKQYSASFGPIHHILVENVSGAPRESASYDSIRLLPGVKEFPDGSTLDCPISDCVLRNLTDIREFKLYDQPNLERGRDNDLSAAVGELRNLHFEHLTFNRPGNILVHAETDGLTVRDVRLNFSLTPDYRLIEIGPLSATYKFGSEDPAKWVEIFSPDRDCTMRHLDVSGVRVADSAEDIPIGRLVKVITQKPNPNYPNTTPRGGTGKGIWVRS